MQDFNKYIGIPFLEKGRDFNGCDCWGLVYLILKNEFKIEVPTYTDNYMSGLEKQELHDLIVNERVKYTFIKPGSEKPGDIVNFRVDGKDMHVGIVYTEKWFLHVMRGINSVQERLYSLKWKNRIVVIGRHEELT